MEQSRRRVANFFRKAKLFCIFRERRAEEKDDGINKMKIFATAYTGISPRFY